MVNNTTLSPRTLMNGMATGDVGTLQGLRSEARQLLERLETSRTRSEQRLAENGQRDPMRSVTGRTALESAIESARAMIERIDALLADFESELDEDEWENKVARSSKPVTIGSCT